jgi:U3 small nucleolar RNA-associated protein 12
VLNGDESEVSQIASSPDNVHLAVGYADGKINIFNLITTEVVTVFCGHNTAISSLSFDALGHRLASGGKVRCSL